MTTTLHLPSFFSNDVAVVEDEAHHHLFKVKRLQVGERLRVVDGKGHARWAEITGIDKRSARLALGAPAPANEPALAVEIFVAVPKPDRAAWLVEKATEIGVVAIQFVSTDREARSLEAPQLARLRRIAVSAVEQCGRSVLPEIASAGNVRDALARTRAQGVPNFVLDPAGAPVRAIATSGGRLGLFVGPEGGWSPEERAVFDREESAPWSLGDRILRIETAAVLAAGVILELYLHPLTYPERGGDSSWSENLRKESLK